MMGKQVTTPKKKQDKKKPRQKRAEPGKRKRFSLPPNSIPGKMQADLYGFIHDKMERLQRADRKKLFLLNFPYLLFASNVLSNCCFEIGDFLNLDNALTLYYKSSIFKRLIQM